MTKRINFIATQSAHMVPTEHVQKNRIRTGYERTLAHMVNKTYAGVAQQDGKVTKIDEQARLIEITYQDGTKDIFEYGEKYEEISGLCITHKLESLVTVGQKIEKGDIITYNKGFFNYDPYSKQVDFSIGNLANVCMIERDVTNEDSAEISARLSQKMIMYPTNMRVVMLTANSHVYAYKKIGEHVVNTDPLLVFEEESLDGGTKLMGNDEEALSMLSELNRRTPSAHFNGEIVKIDAYYGCPLSDMHPTLSAIVKDAIAVVNKQNKLAKGTIDEFDYPESRLMAEGSKYKGVTFDKNTVCLIYYIKETMPQGRGDKLVVCNQLKCTVAGVFPKPIYTESGVEVDVFFSANCAAKRIALSPLMHGILARCIEKIEQDAVDIYFNDKE